MVQDATKQHSKQKSAKTAEAYNKKVKHTPFKEGDLVYYKQIPKDRTKLDPKYAGPVKVVRRHLLPNGSPGPRYTLRYGDGKEIMRTYEQLKGVKADLQDPIAKVDLPLAPAPRISMVPFRAMMDSDDKESVPKSKDSPVACRTRSKRVDIPKSRSANQPVPGHQAVPAGQDHLQ